MHRSVLFAVLAGLSLSVGTATAMEKPFRVSFAGDAFDGQGWTTGVRIELAEGWKTYWRMPGEAGIPPQFTWTTSAPADVSVSYPVPGRFADASGETVGYTDEVIFPVTVAAGNATGLTLGLDLFFAVCKDICIPAQATASIDLGTSVRDPGGSRDVDSWQARVPVTGDLVTAASVDATGDKPVLVLTLSGPADDIFVESDTGAYFRKPSFSPDGREARLVVDNLKDATALMGKAMTVTASAGGKGLEQRVTLP